MKAQQAANTAEAAVIRDPPILYSQEDCQGFIEATVRRAGGQIKDYAINVAVYAILDILRKGGDSSAAEVAHQELRKHTLGKG